MLSQDRLDQVYDAVCRQVGSVLGVTAVSGVG